MLLILRRGLETNDDLGDRLRFLQEHAWLWSLGWLSWTLAAVTVLGFYVSFAAAYRSLPSSKTLLTAALASAVFAVAADLAAQALEVFFLPGLARAQNTASFLYLHRRSVLLTGFLANALYTLSAALLQWASRAAYPGWVRLGGLGVVAGGAMLSTAALLGSGLGMALSNVVLVPSLLVWLAGVGIATPSNSARLPDHGGLRRRAGGSDD